MRYINLRFTLHYITERQTGQTGETGQKVQRSESTGRTVLQTVS